MSKDASLGYELRDDGDPVSLYHSISFSLYRFENGKSVLSGKEIVDCAGKGYFRFSNESNTSGQYLSATQCDSANITELWAPNLKDDAGQVVGELNTGLPPLQPGSSMMRTGSTIVEWSQDDQFVLVCTSTESLAQIYVIARDDLNFSRGILKPVFTSQDLLLDYSQPVIQPVDVPPQPKP